MKNYIRTIHVNGSKSEYESTIDLLDLSNCYRSVIYRADLSIDKANDKHGIINNITTRQTLVVNYEGSYTKSVIIEPNYYSIDTLIANINTVVGRTVFSIKMTDSNAFHSTLHCAVNFKDAKELQDIFGYQYEYTDGVSEFPCNITQNKHVLQLYSNAVDSNMPSSLFNFRIDDPAIDFHKSFYINAGMQNKKYNKIDFLFRDIADNVVTLNASSITLTLFIKSFETWDRLSDDCINMNEIDVSKFNITTNISKLDENGCYTKYLDKSLNLKNAKIVNANFLLKGKLYNLPVDQHLTINNNSYTIPKGCYSLDTLLATLNNLDQSVFSYIETGENAFKIKMINGNSLSFEESDLPNILGFTETAHQIMYNVTPDNNTITYNSMYLDERVKHTITIQPDLYTEQDFLKAVEEALNCNMAFQALRAEGPGGRNLEIP